jgi:hypothetical protein
MPRITLKRPPDEEALPDRLPPLPRDCGAGKRWRFRRDAVIYIAHRGGVSQRMLAEVFDLTRSRVAEIIKKFEYYRCVNWR